MGRSVEKLRGKLETAVQKGKHRQALNRYAELEQVEPATARWPQRRGDLLRRLGHTDEAKRAYERAIELHAQWGFVARAAALAKVLLTLDPSRTDVLEKVDPEEARRLYRQQRTQASSAHESAPGDAGFTDAAIPLVHAKDAGEDEVRFVDAEQGSEDVDLDLTVEELAPADPAPSPGPADVSRMMTPAQVARLPSTPLFAEVPEDALSKMVLGSDLIELDSGEALVRTGDPADRLYVVVEGQVQVRVPGLESPIRLGPGEVVGESCLLEGAERSADVLASGHVRALAIPKSVLGRMIGTYPKIEDVLYEMLARRVILNLVRTSPLFAEFDDSTKLELARMFEVRRAAADIVLLEHGKRADGLYILLVGSAEWWQPGTTAQPVTRGRPFGEHSLLSNATSDLTLRLTSEALVLRLPASRFSELAAMYPPVLARLSQLSMNGLDEPFIETA
jgi:CRP-like cAMP-binding protein